MRGVAVREVVGGKGNNVARALKRLGRTARPVTFLGGPNGPYCENLLRTDDGLEPLVVPVASPTRVILTVRTAASPEQTAFFDPDPSISEEEAETLYRQVEQALLNRGVDALTLSGSSPAPATHGLYSELIALAKARGVPVFLDTYGPSLDAIWGFWPTAIQINRREAAVFLRKTQVTDQDIASLLREWDRHGVSLGVVTDGREPVSVLFRGKRYRAIPPEITPVNPIGSGDSVLAGLVDGWLNRRHAVACGVSNALVWDAGAIEPAEVTRWSSEIEIEPITH